MPQLLPPLLAILLCATSGMAAISCVFMHGYPSTLTVNFKLTYANGSTQDVNGLGYKQVVYEQCDATQTVSIGIEISSGSSVYPSHTSSRTFSSQPANLVVATPLLSPDQPNNFFVNRRRRRRWAAWRRRRTTGEASSGQVWSITMTTAQPATGYTALFQVASSFYEKLQWYKQESSPGTSLSSTTATSLGVTDGTAYSSAALSQQVRSGSGGTDLHIKAVRWHPNMGALESLGAGATDSEDGMVGEVQLTLLSGDSEGCVGVVAVGDGTVAFPYELVGLRCTPQNGRAVPSLTGEWCAVEKDSYASFDVVAKNSLDVSGTQMAGTEVVAVTYNSAYYNRYGYTLSAYTVTYTANLSYTHSFESSSSDPTHSMYSHTIDGLNSLTVEPRYITRWSNRRRGSLRFDMQANYEQRIRSSIGTNLNQIFQGVGSILNAAARPATSTDCYVGSWPAGFVHGTCNQVSEYRAGTCSAETEVPVLALVLQITGISSSAFNDDVKLALAGSVATAAGDSVQDTQVTVVNVVAGSRRSFLPTGSRPMHMQRKLLGPPGVASFEPQSLLPGKQPTAMARPDLRRVTDSVEAWVDISGVTDTTWSGVSANVNSAAADSSAGGLTSTFIANALISANVISPTGSAVTSSSYYEGYGYSPPPPNSGSSDNGDNSYDSSGVGSDKAWVIVLGVVGGLMCVCVAGGVWVCVKKSKSVLDRSSREAHRTNLEQTIRQYQHQRSMEALVDPNAPPTYEPGAGIAYHDPPEYGFPVAEMQSLPALESVTPNPVLDTDEIGSLSPSHSVPANTTEPIATVGVALVMPKDDPEISLECTGGILHKENDL
eukprot:TRINITY_DN17294_c0_g1_i13.p1 TRINITY_DN17294_c0_g1~~TRINITY_DN17294_c0_g1_i13.p1  ORF type:complete len:830 (+),score=121.94 TRINITY_DN17294_c0_g1_i13:195-2684(+)